MHRLGSAYHIFILHRMMPTLRGSDYPLLSLDHNTHQARNSDQEHHVHSEVQVEVHAIYNIGCGLRQVLSGVRCSETPDRSQ